MTVKNESMTDGKTANYALERDKGACPGKARASSKCEATYTTKQGDYAFEAYVARRHEPPSRVADGGRWKHPKCSINGAWYEMIGERRWTLGRRRTRLMGGTGVLERDRLR